MYAILIINLFAQKKKSSQIKRHNRKNIKNNLTRKRQRRNFRAVSSLTQANEVIRVTKGKTSPTEQGLKMKKSIAADQLTQI